MKTFAAALLVSVADGSPCACIFDVDATLISWSSQQKCPNAQSDGFYSDGYEKLRAEGSYRLGESFCKDCYLGTISAGSAGSTSGGYERDDIVKMLQRGGKLNTDKWNPSSSGCHNKGQSPLITDCSDKPSAVPGILKYYKDTEGVTIANKDVHFFDDQPYNIVTFEGSGYNAHQVSCDTTGGSTGGYDGGEDKCAASLDEVNNSPGLKYCCSGSQVSPASGSAPTTQCGTPCHFPFTYNGKKHTSCTTDGEVAPWCATVSKYDSTNWGYCYGGGSDVAVNQTISDVVV